MPDFPSQNVIAPEVEAVIPPVHGIARRLARSFAVYGGANFGIRALNFLLVVVYAHYLRPSDYGIIYLGEIVASFLVIFAGLSTDSALERLYFQHNQDAEELRSYLGSAIRSGFSGWRYFLHWFCFWGQAFNSICLLMRQFPSFLILRWRLRQRLQYRPSNFALPYIRPRDVRGPMLVWRSF